MKDIPGFEGRYAVTKDGRLWSYPKTWHNGKCFITSKGSWLSLCNHTGGYQTLRLKDSKGKTKNFYVHRLIAQTFVPNPNNLPEVNHKDTNKKNNHYLNLEWVTRKENSDHAKINGLYKHEPARGENHADAKLTDKSVVEIRKLHKKGIKQSLLCSKYGITKSAMSSVCNCKSWKHLPC